MKIVIFLAAVSAANIFVGVDGFNRIEMQSFVRRLPSGGFQVIFKSFDRDQNFKFHGHVNRKIRDCEAGSITGGVNSKVGDYWIYTNPSVNLGPADILYYWISIEYQRGDLHAVPARFPAVPGRVRVYPFERRLLDPEKEPDYIDTKDPNRGGRSRL